MDKLTVGYIPYLNCVPFFHYLFDCGFHGELVSGVPARLNQLLQEDKLDVSPSSSFEYARNWRDYLLLPDFSISSIGKVHSVLLFSPVVIESLEGQQIAITGESATSINLLRIILREFYNLSSFSDFVPQQPVEKLIENRRPALLIGDRALNLAGCLPEGMFEYDLGEIWQKYTGLPFVFALWMIRRNALPKYMQELSCLGRQLRTSLEKVLAKPEAIAVQQATEKLTSQQIIDYWGSIDYRLTDSHLRGLQLYFELCKKHQLLEEEPHLEFFQAQV